MIKYKLYSIPIFELRSDSSKISGMSLMELLVAFTIFVMLISILRVSIHWFRVLVNGRET